MIGEIKRDDSLDYLYVLKSLNEIPFPVGKKLLADFLKGDMKNSSVKKNKMYLMHNFGALKNSSVSKIRSMIENLITNGLIDLSQGFNKFSKVLGISLKGKEELMSPSLNKKKIKNKVNLDYVKISEEDRKLFGELDFFLSRFNDFQKKAIISNSEKILCIAGAGSGKTSVLVKRMEFLVKYKSIDPEKILAITFTRKAKQEMEARLGVLGIRTNVETFNSFAERILRKYGHKIYARDKRVMTYSEKILAINFALDNVGVNMNSAIDKYFTDKQKRNKERHNLSNIFVNDCFSVLEFFKTQNKELYDFSENMKKNKENARLIYRICLSLKQFMDMQGLRDFTDQVLDCISLFNEHSDLIPEFEHVLVDEYQDVNDMQIELLGLLNKNNLFCVGDPRQSIFGWRGSNIEYILRFQEEHPGAEIIGLNKNYRSHKKIIDFMNLGIKDLGLEDLESHSSLEGEIKIFNFGSEEEEHNFVVNKILDLPIEKEEIFILARTNRILNELSNKLKARGISHKVKSDEIKRPVVVREGEVVLATVHAIKGLEAKAVFVVGCNDLNFPCKASDHPVLEFVKDNDFDKEEEEKRLFYVAISRAKEKLYLILEREIHFF